MLWSMPGLGVVMWSTKSVGRVGASLSATGGSSGVGTSLSATAEISRAGMSFLASGGSSGLQTAFSTCYCDSGMPPTTIKCSELQSVKYQFLYCELFPHTLHKSSKEFLKAHVKLDVKVHSCVSLFKMTRVLGAKNKKIKWINGQMLVFYWHWRLNVKRQWYFMFSHLCCRAKLVALVTPLQSVTSGQNLLELPTAGLPTITVH